MSRPPADRDVLGAINEHAEIMRAFYDRINNVHKRPLNQGQVQIAKDYFLNKKDLILGQCGRNFGKTESILYIATVAAALNPNFWVMIITPELKQGKKIYFTSGRLPNYAPPQLVLEKTVEKVTFKNGSVITIDGCENYDALRGVKPHLVIYDEFQDHSKEFHLEVMQPNLLGKSSALIVFGTPPKKRSAYFVEFREQVLKRLESKEEEDRKGVSYYELPTEMNPSIDKVKLHRIRKELIDSGNEIIWKREYLGQICFGGEDVVFPKWNPQQHCKKHSLVMSYLEHDKTKLKWFTICDPGTSTCFAVLFVCYNPFTQQIFMLDEIYEKDRKRTDSRQMWERIRNKEKELYPDAQAGVWKRYYDEAAAWFYNEIAAMHRGQMLSLSPSRKQHSNEETDISRIKMLMAQPGALIVSERCYWLRWEIESYVTVFDKNGDAVYVDSDNHLLDCLSGETKVHTLDGEIDIAKLVGKTGYLYSRDGKICKFDSVRKTHTQVPMVKVEFSDGRFVRCTPNHEFLIADGSWKKASSLSSGVLIQCNTYGDQNTEQYRARVQRKALSKISRREIFQSWLQTITSSSLGAFQWVHPEGIACPSFGWGLHQQSNKQFIPSVQQDAYKFTYDQEAKTRCEKAYVRDSSSIGQGLAWDGRRLDLAFSKLKTDVEESRTYNQGLSGVWKTVSNEKFWKKFLLSSKLQEPRSEKAAQVTRIRYAGTSDTYCMNVEDTHCFAVNGGIIAHNCCKYLMQVSNWTLMEKAEEIKENFAGTVSHQIVETVDNWADAAVENSLFPGDGNGRFDDFF